MTKPVNQAVGFCPKDLACENVEFLSKSNSQIKGWFIDGEKGKGAVILMHGIRSNRTQMIDRMRFLNKVGFSVLAFDFQSHAESIGEQIGLGYTERLDSDAAIEFIKNKLPNEKIGILGISMGGAAFLLSEKKSNSDAVILEMVYPTMEKAVENRLNLWLFEGADVIEPILTIQFKPRLGVSIDALRPIDKINELKIPQLFIVAENDVHTTLDESKDFFNRANSPKNFWIVLNAEHEDLLKVAPTDYEKNVLDFFNANLN